METVPSSAEPILPGYGVDTPRARHLHLPGTEPEIPLCRVWPSLIRTRRPLLRSRNNTGEVSATPRCGGVPPGRLTLEAHHPDPAPPSSAETPRRPRGLLNVVDHGQSQEESRRQEREPKAEQEVPPADVGREAAGVESEGQEEEGLHRIEKENADHDSHASGVGRGTFVEGAADDEEEAQDEADTAEGGHQDGQAATEDAQAATLRPEPASRDHPREEEHQERERVLEEIDRPARPQLGQEEVEGDAVHQPVDGDLEVGQPTEAPPLRHGVSSEKNVSASFRRMGYLPRGEKVLRRWSLAEVGGA